MNRASSILLAVTLVLVLTSTLSARVARASVVQSTPTSISRLVSVSNYGLTFITDEIILQEGSSISIGIPSEYKGNLVEYYTADPEVTVAAFTDSQHPNIIFLNVTSQSPRHQLSLVTVLRGVIWQEMSGAFNLTFPETPVLLQELQTFNISIVLPKDADIKIPPVGFNLTKTNETVTLYTEARALAPVTKDDLSISFNSETIDLFSVRSDEVTINFDGELNIQEKLCVTFQGTGETDTLSLRIPKESQITLLKGLLGELDRTVGNESQGLVTVAVKLRQAITRGENASLTIQYKAPVEAFTTESEGEHIIHFPQSLNSTYNDYKIWIIFPSTYVLKKFEPKPQGFIREDPYRVKLMYQREDTALKRQNSAQLHYEMSFSMSQYYSWIWGAAILLGAIGLATRLTPVAGLKPAAMAPETKRLIEEALEIYVRTNKMRQQVLTRSTVETARKGDTALLRESMRTIKRDSERMRDPLRRLRKVQPALASTLAELEKTEGVIQELLSAYNRVNEDLRRGRISKKVGQRIQREYSKQIHGHISTEEELVEEIKRSAE